MATYVCFGAVSDSMFADEYNIVRREKITSEKVRGLVNRSVVSCVHMAHEAAMGVLKRKVGVEIEVLKEPLLVTLEPFDEVVVVEVRDLPLLVGRIDYTREEIAQATFTFSLYTVLL